MDYDLQLAADEVDNILKDLNSLSKKVERAESKIEDMGITIPEKYIIRNRMKELIKSIKEVRDRL